MYQDAIKMIRKPDILDVEADSWKVKVDWKILG